MQTQLKIFASLGLCAALSAVACGSGTEENGGEGGNGTKGTGSTGNLGGADGNGQNSGSGTGSTSGSGSSGNGTGSTSGSDPNAYNGVPNDVDFDYDPSEDADPETCAAKTIQAEVLPVDVFIMLDRSGSMEWLTEEDVAITGAKDCAVGSSVNARWCNAINAIDGFVTDNSSVGTGIGLATFAGSGSGPGSGCGYQTSLAVPLDIIESGDANGQQEAVRDELDARDPGSGTATERAINTLIKYTTDRQTELESTGEKRTVIGIVVTDGVPTECETDTSKLNELVVDHLADTGIPTFFVGMTGLDTTKLEEMAVNGSGTGTHADDPSTSGTDECGGLSECTFYSVGTGDKSVFLNVLNTIRESVSGCDFAIPSSEGVVDLNSLDVTFTPGGGATEVLGKKADEAACASNNGYYVDGAGTDAIIHLCPTTCDRSDSTSSVDIELKCAGQ